MVSMRRDGQGTDDVFCLFDTRLTFASQKYGLVHVQHAECAGQKCGGVVKVSRCC